MCGIAALDPLEFGVVALVAVDPHLARESDGVELQRRPRITVLVLHHLQFREQRLEPFRPDVLAGELAAIATERATLTLTWLTIERRVEELAHLDRTSKKELACRPRRSLL
jgi:hypothetical protein